MEPFETFDHAGCVVELHTDDDPQSPAEWDTLGTLYDFRADYRGMESPHTNAAEAMERGGVALLVRYLRLCGVRAVPYDIYDYGSNGLTIKEADLSDDHCSGYIAADAASIAMTGVEPADVEEGLRAELGTWSSFFAGEVVGYVVTRNGETVGSCWGFFPDADKPGRDGLEYVREQAREEAEHEEAEARRALAQGIPTR